MAAGGSRCRPPPNAGCTGGGAGADMATPGCWRRGMHQQPGYMNGNKRSAHRKFDLGQVHTGSPASIKRCERSHRCSPGPLPAHSTARVRCRQVIENGWEVTRSAQLPTRARVPTATAGTRTRAKAPHVRPTPPTRRLADACQPNVEVKRRGQTSRALAEARRRGRTVRPMPRPNGEGMGGGQAATPGGACQVPCPSAPATGRSAGRSSGLGVGLGVGLGAGLDSGLGAGLSSA